MRDMLIGLILGVSLGVQGHKLYQLNKENAVQYSQKELREKVTENATLSCIDGVVSTALAIINDNPTANCEAIGKKWGDIYK